MPERDPRLLLTGRGRSWVARAAFAVLGVALAAVAFFFVTIALIVGAVAALVIAARFWWVIRRTRAQAAAAGPIEGEFKRVDRDRLR